MNRNGRKRILLVACALAAVFGLSLAQNPVAAQFPSYTPPPMHTFSTPSFGGRSYSPPAMSRPTIGPRQYPSGPPVRTQDYVRASQEAARRQTERQQQLNHSYGTIYRDAQKHSGLYDSPGTTTFPSPGRRSYGAPVRYEYVPGDVVETTTNTPMKRMRTILATVPAGMVLDVVEVRGDWAGVTVLVDGREVSGWISKRYLKSAAVGVPARAPAPAAPEPAAEIPDRPTGGHPAAFSTPPVSDTSTLAGKEGFERRWRKSGGKLSAGMAKEAVTQILGQPSYCRLKVAGDGLSELLFYERTSGTSTIVLEFDANGRLVLSNTPTGVTSEPANRPGVAKKTTQAEGRLKKGMSKQDVVSIMGTPSFRK
ncbi:MAG: hypothetical protein ACOC7K_00100 [bacterium]